MKVLLLGAKGMLGQAIFNKFSYERFNVITVARSNCDYNIDLAVETEKLKQIIQLENPDVIINAAALINVKECEDYPAKAYLINARLPGVIAEVCKKTGSFFVQVSTDHYYNSEGKTTHCENDNIFLINEYANSKYAGEAFALTYSNSLVIRTNIVGFRNNKDKLTFIEWVIQSLQNGQMIMGFEDYYTSSIDVYHFSEILLKLINKKVTGVINVGSTDVLSKYDFINELAKLLRKEKYVRKGKMNQLVGVQRASSLGLDVTKLKGILNDQSVPSSSKVIYKLVEKYKEGVFHEL